MQNLIKRKTFKNVGKSCGKTLFRLLLFVKFINLFNHSMLFSNSINEEIFYYIRSLKILKYQTKNIFILILVHTSLFLQLIAITRMKKK